MENRIKSALLFISLVVLPYCCSAQWLTTNANKIKLNTYTPIALFPNTIQVNTSPQTERHTFSWYLPHRFRQEQVISIKQHNSINDRTYYINPKGKLNYTSMAITAPANQFHIHKQRDSFNPYGVSHAGNSLLQGALSLLFQSL